MPARTLAARVENLEMRVSALEELPRRLDSIELQFLHLREHVDGKFSALEQKLEQKIEAGDDETRRFMRVLHEEVLSRIALLQEGLDARR